MKYDITTKEAPIMPNLGSGCECIRLLASQVAPEMRQQVVPMLFPALATYMSGCEFLYPDNSYKEITGLLAHLVADSGTGKAQLQSATEAANFTSPSNQIATVNRNLLWNTAQAKKMELANGSNLP